MLRPTLGSDGTVRRDRTLHTFSGAARSLPVERLTPVHRQVLSYWEEKRGTRPGPARADIDPTDIPRALQHVLLWVPEVDGNYRCRLSGSAIDDTLEMSLKGVALRDIRCQILDEAFREFDAVRDHMAASYAERTMAWAGKPFLFYRHLLLPVVGPANEVERILSVLTFHNLKQPSP